MIPPTTPRRPASDPSLHAPAVPLTPEALNQAQRRALARLNGQAWGISVGLVCAVGLLAATWILVIRQGPHMGAHLGLLSIFLPGYSVSWLGGVIGFVYAFVIGYALGRLIGLAYNAQVSASRS